MRWGDEMTDARIPERYLMDRRVVRLTDGQFRSFVMGTLWSVSNRTDGRVEPDDLALIPNFAAGSIKALVDAGLWLPQPHGWLMADFATTQTSRHDLEVLENIRRADREKKARKRAGSPLPPRDDPRDTSPGTAQERKGQERQGEASNNGVQFDPEVDPKTGEVIDLKPGMQDTCRVCGMSLGWAVVREHAICGRDDKKHREAKGAA
jgi:hypothetical protein